MLTLLLLHLRVPHEQKIKLQGDDRVIEKIAFYEVRKITERLET